jgi:hypothetical protein
VDYTGLAWNLDEKYKKIVKPELQQYAILQLLGYAVIVPWAGKMFGKWENFRGFSFKSLTNLARLADFT